jgi:hypothetical protein
MRGRGRFGSDYRERLAAEIRRQKQEENRIKREQGRDRTIDFRESAEKEMGIRRDKDSGRVVSFGVKPISSYSSGPVLEAKSPMEAIARIGRNYTTDIGDATSRIIQDTFLGGKGESGIQDNALFDPTSPLGSMLSMYMMGPSGTAANIVGGNLIKNPDFMQTIAPSDFFGAGALLKGAGKVLLKGASKAGSTKKGKAFSGLLAGLGGFGATNEDAQAAPVGKALQQGGQKAGSLLDLLKPQLEDVTKLTDDVIDDVDNIINETTQKSGNIIVPNKEETARILRALNYPEGVLTDDVFETGLEKILERITSRGLTISDDVPGLENKDPIEGISSRILTTMGRSAAGRLKGQSPLFDFLSDQGLIRFDAQIDPARWDQLTSIMRNFTGGEGLMPSTINARVFSDSGQKVRPFQWQPDHAPFGVSWVDKALNEAIPVPEKLGSKAQKEIAEGYNWLFNESGILIPKPANIGLGSFPRIGKESLGWKNLENMFPNQAGALEDLGLLKMYDDLATKMQTASKTTFDIANQYDSAKAIKDFLDKVRGFQGRYAGI